MRNILLILISIITASVFAQNTTTELRELYISSTPAGAKIYIDGQEKGRTPTTITIPDSNPHILDIKLRKFKNIRQTIQIPTPQKQSLDFTLEKITGLAIIKTSSPGVNVTIDNIDKGTTPLLITDLPLGTYRVHLSAPGFLDRNMELVINDRTPIELKAQLFPNTALITVKSEPAGAEVTINGAIKGTTPCDIPNIPQGKYTLELKLDGYTDFKQTIRLHAGKSENIDVKLEPLPATLQITTTPNADIYINNKFKDIAPVKIKNLPAGEYSIRIEKKGYDTIEESIHLNNGDNIIKQFELVSNTGAFEVTTEPSNVKVYVDGKWLGLTTTKSNETDNVSDTLTLAEIPAGKHKITFSAKGYFTKEISVNIARNKTVTRHIKLKRRFIPDCEVRTKTDVYRGILIMIDPAGNVKLETHPGVMRVIEKDDIVSRKPLRMQDMLKELNNPDKETIKENMQE